MQILDIELEVAVKKSEMNPSSIISEERSWKEESLSITYESKEYLTYVKKMQKLVNAAHLLSSSPRLQAKVFD